MPIEGAIHLRSHSIPLIYIKNIAIKFSQLIILAIWGYILPDTVMHWAYLEWVSMSIEHIVQQGGKQDIVQFGWPFVAYYLGPIHIFDKLPWDNSVLLTSSSSMNKSNSPPSSHRVYWICKTKQEQIHFDHYNEPLPSINVQHTTLQSAEEQQCWHTLGSSS